MKLSFFMSLILGFLLTPAIGYSFTCPEWISERQSQLPECPEGGLVPESFPLGAIVVSDFSTRGVRSSEFTADVVKKVLRNAGDQNPLLILPVAPETLESVKKEIMAMDATPDQKEKWLKSIVPISNASYTWQQDLMQPFINPKSGKLQLRKVEGYQEDRGQSDIHGKIAKQLRKCGFESGPLLKTQSQGRELTSGHYGGNIEGLPGGICLLGDDALDSRSQKPIHWQRYADQICEPGEENQIKVPTYWLNVGHTDEIVKVLPNKTREKPCDFSIAISSPRKAIELLRKDSKGSFFDFKSSSPRLDQEFSYKVRGSSALSLVCRDALSFRGERYLKQKRQDQQSSKTMSDGRNWYDVLIKVARASGFVTEESDSIEECENMTNGEIADLFDKVGTYRDYQNAIQAELDQLKNEMKAKLAKKLPQCEVDIFEVPDLYVGGYTLRVGGVRSELSHGMGVSLMPNSTNGVTLNNVSIHSDPHVGAFKKYTAEENQKRGLNTEFVDTFEYAHVGYGNLHCSTNTMYICKPRGSK